MNDVLTSISIKARGDMRAALNDLQSLSKMDEKTFIKEIGDRNKEVSIFNALQFVFKNAQIDNKMLGVYEEVNMDVDEIFLWIEENIPYEYKGRELYKAFDALSHADVFRGRIHRQQHWRFLVYESFFLGSGIAAAKKYNRTGWTNYKKPSRILKIWLNNQRMAKKKSICEKYAKIAHLSIKQAMKDFLVIRQILNNQKVRKEIKLDEDEIEFLDKPIIA
jgi:replication factor C large subunit